MPRSASRNPYFNIGTSPVDPGVYLIEASAGTGKTYAIAGLAVRLIAEFDVPLREILIVTYTEAATRELRERIRSRIRDAMQSLIEGKTGDDDALAAFREGGTGEREKAIRSLKNALLSFDEAAIFTIHGFCQRMLRENAFETGVLMDVELVTKPEPLWQQTVEDFWRIRFHEVDEGVAAVAAWLQQSKVVSIERLVKTTQLLACHPELVILHDGERLKPVERVRAELGEILEEIRNGFRAGHGEIKGLLYGFRWANKPLKPPALDPVFEELERLLTPEPVLPGTISALMQLSNEAIGRGTRKGKEPPTHSFFDLCSKLEYLVFCFSRTIFESFVGYLRTGLAEQKRQRNVMTFDDLLNQLYDALQGDGAPGLIRTIGARFQAALIDEFQDTDPVQWEIFRRVFGGGRHRLFLIGDPKQAIYGFRGADIFTYMKARRVVPESNRFTLGTNWRSDPLLIDGVNTLFGHHPAPFIFSDIPFEPVLARGDVSPEIDVTGTELDPRPMQLVHLVRDDGGVYSAADARRLVGNFVVSEIIRLLKSGARRNGKELEPADIAILVRAHREAAELQRALMRENVPAIIRTEASVLQTEEAVEMERFLVAVMEPFRDVRVRAALATRLFAWSADRIDEYAEDEEGWHQIIEQFQEWQRIWIEHGFMRMFRHFFQNEKERLFGLADGERMVTNFQHIAECLHRAEYEKRLSPSGLLRWFGRERSEPDGEAKHHIVRLEKDEKAVQIVTIHASKGLEYPVVFCPFNWVGIERKNSEILFHDEANDNLLTWDCRQKADAETRMAFGMENRAEAMRLLYVALTRARNRCYLIWPQTKDSLRVGQNTLSTLFVTPSGEPFSSPEEAFRSLKTNISCAVRSLFGGKSAGKYRPRNGGEVDLCARKVSRSVPQSRLITSFSGMTAGADEFQPDHDRVEAVPVLESEQEAGGWTVFSFPKGANAGNFFHALLERIDFSGSEDISPLVLESLKRFRFPVEFEPAVTKSLRMLLEIPFIDGVSLSEIPPSDRLVETVFYYPVLPVGSRQLADVFDAGDFPEGYVGNLGRLNFQPTDGYMTGFIDLIVRVGERYYIIDWKSNWLGGTVEDYRSEKLPAAMGGSYYFLQYQLYSLALHLHLGATLADYDFGRNFGGVYYVFLRGIDSDDPGSGIYSDRLSLELIERLSGRLIPERERGREPALRGISS